MDIKSVFTPGAPTPGGHYSDKFLIVYLPRLSFPFVLLLFTSPADPKAANLR
jgi:hypothetical protein